MEDSASDLARRLADAAEAACRHYLSNGVREGRYWRVGDVQNTPGRSMFVRLLADANGRPAGKWTDAATGEHGDLLDIIRESCGLIDFQAVAEEARRFLSMPRPEPPERTRLAPAPQGSPDSARRLFAASRAISGTPADAYLRSRRVELAPADVRALRFHPRCYYWPDADAPKRAFPALIAAVTDAHGAITGAHRTWLRPPAARSAPTTIDRRAMGRLLGNGVRFGEAGDVLAAGEGLETTLSVRVVMPTLPLVAALSAAHLGALVFPPSLKRLYILRDADPAGDCAFARLTERGGAAGVEVIGLSPRCDDFNTDLVDLGADHLRRLLRPQLLAADAELLISA